MRHYLIKILESVTRNLTPNPFPSGKRNRIVKAWAGGGLKGFFG